ncbi:hypothetical protein QBC39DRAFT_385600 [Podospora conica]|nr:hypothetical protein QBC39DRAFT_385600 [Schizothecium conicum]
MSSFIFRGRFVDELRTQSRVRPNWDAVDRGAIRLFLAQDKPISPSNIPTNETLLDALVQHLIDSEQTICPTNTSPVTLENASDQDRLVVKTCVLKALRYELEKWIKTGVVGVSWDAEAKVRRLDYSSAEKMYSACDEDEDSGSDAGQQDPDEMDWRALTPPPVHTHPPNQHVQHWSPQHWSPQQIGTPSQNRATQPLAIEYPRSEPRATPTAPAPAPAPTSQLPLTSERLAQMQRAWDSVEATARPRRSAPQTEQAHQPRATTPTPDPLSRHDASQPLPTTAEPVETAHPHLGPSLDLSSPTPPATPAKPKAKVVRLQFNPKSKPAQATPRPDLTAAREPNAIMHGPPMSPARNSSVDDLTKSMSRAGLFHPAPLSLRPEPPRLELEIPQAVPRLGAGAAHDDATSRSPTGLFPSAPLSPRPDPQHLEVEIPHIGSRLQTGAAHVDPGSGLDHRALRRQRYEWMLDKVAQLRKAREDAIGARVDMQALMMERLLTTRPRMRDQVARLDSLSHRMSQLHVACRGLHRDLAPRWAIQGAWTGSTLDRMIFGKIQHNTLESGREVFELEETTCGPGLDSLVRVKGRGR